jgi:ADP-heptose:LPS heptosyltransferase
MKLSTMRRVDLWVGVPVCFLVSLAVKALEALRGVRPARPKRLLFIELSEMGSTILAAPSVQRAMSRYDQKPCFVIFKKNVESLRLLDIFEEEDIFAIRESSLVTLLIDLARFPFFCHRKGIDTTIDLELYARISSLLSMVSGARTRVGFDNYLGEGLHRGNHLTHRVNYCAYYHMSQNFMALVEALEHDRETIPLPKAFVPVPELTVRVPHKDEPWQYVRRELTELYPLEDDTRVVLLNHDAGKLLPIRTWPEQRFAAVARKLIDWDPNVIVVLMGVKASLESARQIVRAVDRERLVNLVGRTRTLDDVIQLFHQSDLLITNDSGPAHFATLTEIASITLFGPETSHLYGPLGERAVNLYKELACSPCLTAVNHRNSPCTDNVCLQEITVDEVFAAATRLLGTRSEVASR